MGQQGASVAEQGLTEVVGDETDGTAIAVVDMALERASRAPSEEPQEKMEFVLGDEAFEELVNLVAEKIGGQVRDIHSEISHVKQDFKELLTKIRPVIETRRQMSQDFVNLATNEVYNRIASQFEPMRDRVLEMESDMGILSKMLAEQNDLQEELRVSIEEARKKAAEREGAEGVKEIDWRRWAILAIGTVLLGVVGYAGYRYLSSENQEKNQRNLLNSSA